MIHNRRGFSLVELLLVVAVILIIVAIGTPYFLRTTQIAHDASAVAYLRQLQRAQENYRAVNGEYAVSFSQLESNLTFQLAPPRFPLSPFPRVVLAHAGPVPLQGGPPPGQGGTPPGQGGTPPGQGGTPPGGGGPPSSDFVVNSMYIFRLTRIQPDRWEATAEPVRDRTLNRYFFTDNSGVIRFTRGALADAFSTPI